MTYKRPILGNTSVILFRLRTFGVGKTLYFSPFWIYNSTFWWPPLECSIRCLWINFNRFCIVFPFCLKTSFCFPSWYITIHGNFSIWNKLKLNNEWRTLFRCNTFWDSQRDFMSSGVQSTLKTLTFSCSEYKVAKSSNLDSYFGQSVHESSPKMIKVKAELWMASWNSWGEDRVGASAGSGLCLFLLTNPFSSCKTLKIWKNFAFVKIHF